VLGATSPEPSPKYNEDEFLGLTNPLTFGGVSQIMPVRTCRSCASEKRRPVAAIRHT
jgi:hypothetical protein